MEFIESERGNQKLNIKLKKNCGGQLSRGLLTGGQLSGGGGGGGGGGVCCPAPFGSYG